MICRLASAAAIVASSDTQRIQEVHGLLLHLLCDLIEDEPDPRLVALLEGEDRGGGNVAPEREKRLQERALIFGGGCAAACGCVVEKSSSSRTYAAFAFATR